MRHSIRCIEVLWKYDAPSGISIFVHEVEEHPGLLSVINIRWHGESLLLQLCLPVFSLLLKRELFTRSRQSIPRGFMRSVCLPQICLGTMVSIS